MVLDRKEAHLRLARQQQQKNLVNDFDEIRFIHESLPQVNFSQVDLSCHYDHLTFPLPFFINAMTGGTQRALEINETLGGLAQAFNIPLALGSISQALKDPSALPTYTIARKVNPTGFLWVNLSADAPLFKMEQALNLLKADGLQLHLNLPQEIVMPEGDRSFSNWLENIYQAKQTLKVPLMVKETGFGLSQKTIGLLIEAGATLIDVGGRGGTNFIDIENKRREKKEFSYLQDFGQSTVESLLEAQPFYKQADFTATGGIRQPYDLVKALALGAKSVGIAGRLLPVVMEKGYDESYTLLKSWVEQLKSLYVLLGVTKTEDLSRLPLIFSQGLLSYQNQRHLKNNEAEK